MLWNYTDVYVQQSKEEFDLEQKYEKDGTVLEYDNRLKYDAVLKWVIDQWKRSEGSQMSFPTFFYLALFNNSELGY